MTDVPTVTPGRAREIIVECAVKHGVSYTELVGSSRRSKVFAARKEAVRRLSEERNLSTTQIGRMLNRHHTTVLSALGRLARQRDRKD